MLQTAYLHPYEHLSKHPESATFLVSLKPTYQELKPFCLPNLGPIARASASPLSPRMRQGYLRTRAWRSPRLYFPSDDRRSLAPSLISRIPAPQEEASTKPSLCDRAALVLHSMFTAEINYAL